MTSCACYFPPLLFICSLDIQHFFFLLSNTPIIWSILCSDFLCSMIFLKFLIELTCFWSGGSQRHFFLGWVLTTLSEMMNPRGSSPSSFFSEEVCFHYFAHKLFKFKYLWRILWKIHFNWNSVLNCSTIHFGNWLPRDKKRK